MCGIAGLVDPTGAPVDEALLRTMTRAVASRGPDGECLWSGAGVGLGHRRLAVIDLSVAADQPMANEDGNIRVVFNGEIYNFAELRTQLIGKGHAFRSRSDTEVLVHGYEEWGDNVVDHIDGMFAFALWDAGRKRLLAARDRMGKKPFYWAQVPRVGAPPLFVFGSELKALLPVPGFERRIDARALSRYLVQEYVAPPLTIFESARKLDASERLVLDVGKDPHAVPKIDRYWDLPFPESHAPMRPEEAAEELRRLLRRAVEKRLVSDVPLGVFLSGGIDSSTVASFMTEIVGADRIKTFSIGFWDPSFDESAHAESVSRHLGTDHHVERLDPHSLLKILPDVARYLDEPFADASILPSYLLCKFTRKHVTVSLGGDGGDELFAGYPTFKADRVARIFHRLPLGIQRLVGMAADHLPARTGYFSFDFMARQFLRGGDVDGPRRHQRWMASFLPEELNGLLMPDVLAATGGNPLAEVDARAANGPARSDQDRLIDYYARFYLAGDMNVKVDRAAGAVGLEVRAPFLDTDLVRFACGLPPELRVRGWTTKYILKAGMRGRLPDEILDRKKQGFGVPVARWMKEELSSEVRDAFEYGKLRREGFFDPVAVNALLDDHLTGRRDRRKTLWTLFMFERWLDVWAQP